MIKRVSLFKLKRPDTTDKQKVVDALLSMRGNIASLIEIEVGINLSESDQAYDVVLMVTFKDIKSLRQFEQDPFHLAVKKLVVSLKQSRVVVDYEY